MATAIIPHLSPCYIQLRWTTKGWIAIFDGGPMPQNIPLPLPFTSEASAIMVRRDSPGPKPVGHLGQPTARWKIGWPTTPHHEMRRLPRSGDLPVSFQ
jgi:hypothetical protein